MKLFVKSMLTALAVLFFVSANAIEQPRRFFATPFAYHVAKMKPHNAATGKKKHKKMKHKKQSSRGPNCYAY